ncbi:MAG: DUF6465 family protein [Dorea sp.]
MATKKAAAAEEKVVETKATKTTKATEAKATKKTATKKTTAKKDMKVKTVIEYYGKQVDEKDIIASVKKVWTQKGNKIGDIKTMELYIKPEEAAVYFVINGTEGGAVAF